MPLITTPGSSTADSYVSLLEFAAYLAARLHVPAAVTDAPDAVREAALRMATRLIDAMPCPVVDGVAWEFQGAAEDADQALLFPAAGLLDRRGQAIAAGTVPKELKEAVSEFALQLIVGDRTLDSEIETQGITSIKAGPVAVEFKDDVRAKVVPDAVRNLLPSWWCAAPRRPAVLRML